MEMRHERFILVDDQKYFEADLKGLNYEQLKMIVSFLSDERDLRFVQNICDNESIQIYIDNLINKI